MAKQTINIGARANDGTGDDWRVAFDKCNDNFDELYVRTSTATITGGSITGITDLAIADGGTGASTAANARTNLGLQIGTDVQAHSSVLDNTTASYTTEEKDKLNLIEPLADVTDYTTVMVAGAVMDNELTDEAAVKALNQGVATTDSPTFANITVPGTVDGRDVSADGTKLDGIEAGADVTDSVNVTAAGALMDSELTNLAAVKAIDQGLSETDSPTFADLTLSGDLTVNGTTTTLDSTNTTISDNLLELNSGVTSNANDSGILIERGSTGDNIFIGWNEDEDEVLFGTTTATASSTGNLTLTPADIHAASGRFDEEIKLLRATSTSRRIQFETDGTDYNLGTSGGAAIRFVSDASDNDSIQFETHEAGVDHAMRWEVDASGDLLPGTTNTYNIGASGNVVATVYATTFDGEATSAQYADLAENYLADAEYEPGTVLSFGGKHEVTASNLNSPVAGVVSTQPAHLMNSKLTGEHVATVALIGRVPVRVQGPVQKGNFLEPSSTPGVAVATDTPRLGYVVGVALQSTDGSANIIEAVVGRV